MYFWFGLCHELPRPIMDDTKQSVREHVYNFSFCMAVFTLLIVTKVLFQKAESIAYFCCALTVGIANAYHAAGYRAGIVLHFRSIVNITMYQFYYDSHRLYMPSWVSYMAAFGVTVQFILENCVVWVLRNGDAGTEQVFGKVSATVERSPTIKEHITRIFLEVYHDPAFREKHAVISQTYLLIWAFCPISDTGVLRAPWTRLIGMVILWVFIVVFEHYKCRVCKTVLSGDFVVAHTAYKCAALLYLPKPLWTIFAGLILWDFFFILRYRRAGSLWSFVRKG